MGNYMFVDVISRFSRFRTGIVLLMALTAPVGLATAQSSAAEVVEPESGTPFAASLVPAGASTEQQLAGMALRAVEVLFFRVPVYAFGLYVDADGARAALARFANRSPDDLAGDERFYRRLLDLEFGMTLRLVMVRDVATPGEEMASAFDRSLRPRIAPYGVDEPGASRALDRFRDYFDMREIETGAEFIFACTAGGRMTTSINGEERPPIESRALCRALFDVYLGAEPISVEGKKSVIARFPRLLAAAR